MMPVEVYDELVAERVRSVEQAEGSLRAEGLTLRGDNSGVHAMLDSLVARGDR